MPSPVDTVLERLTGARVRAGEGWMVQCPAHDDPDPSLRVCAGTTQPVVLHCHAGCSPERILAALNLTWADLCTESDGTAPAKAAKRPAPSWESEAARYSLNFTEKVRDELAVRLCLPASVFGQFPRIGAWRTEDRPLVGGGWTFPEYNAAGVCLGLAERYYKTDKKSFMKGGNRALSIPTGWRERPGAVYVPEGPSDTLALTAAGLAAVGRPSNTGGTDHLIELFRDVPAARQIVILGENDRKPDGSWPGRDGADRVGDKLAKALNRAIYMAFPPDGVKDARVWLVNRTTVGDSWERAGEAFVSSLRLSTPHGRVRVIISTEEFRVNAAVCEAIADDQDLFVRAGSIVRIVNSEGVEKNNCQFPPSPRITAASTPTLREYVSRRVDFIRMKEGEEAAAHPPEWCVSAVKDRGSWPLMRPLEAVVDYPVMRPDGTILAKAGYDPATCIFYNPNGAEPQIDPVLSLESAKRAWERLRAVVQDFTFKGDMYLSSWLAGVLTPLARFAFRGPAPLFLVDGNVRGVGKGLLCDTIGIIVSGREFATTGFTSDDEEMRKRITAIALEGDRLVLLDNITGNLAGSSLDRALTSTLWKDRILGHTEQMEAPLLATWYGTGNNVQVDGDTARRICHIRIETKDEHPEERNNFVHCNLRAWVVENRPQLLGGALTILAAFAKAGFPQKPGIKTWGSYEGWSAIVRAAILWLGLPDPGETRAVIRGQSDMTSTSMSILISNWDKLDVRRTGLTAAQIINELFPKHGNVSTELVEVAAALEAILPKLNGGALGYKLRHIRARTFGTKFIDYADKDNGVARWKVYDVSHETGLTGDQGDQGDVSDTNSENTFSSPDLDKHPPDPLDPPEKSKPVDFSVFDDK